MELFSSIKSPVYGVAFWSPSKLIRFNASWKLEVPPVKGLNARTLARTSPVVERYCPNVESVIGKLTLVFVVPVVAGKVPVPNTSHVCLVLLNKDIVTVQVPPERPFNPK